MNCAGSYLLLLYIKKHYSISFFAVLAHVVIISSNSFKIAS